MVEWGRLLSGYRGEILGRRFESCPPRYLKKHVREGVFCFRSQAPVEGMVFESCACVLATLENAFREERVFLLPRPTNYGGRLVTKVYEGFI